MYKVFFKDSCFLLTDDRNLLHSHPRPLIHKDFSITKNYILGQLRSPAKFKAVIYHPEAEELLSLFKSCFLYVQAAGGVVCLEDKALVIRHLGVWDLPKGHLEAGESIEECAVREVEEECGLQEVSITAPLTITWHLYFRNETWHLKETYWYKMTCPPGQTPQPQREEDIEAVKWQRIGLLHNLFKKTYRSITEVLRLL